MYIVCCEQELTDRERSNLLSDALSLARAGQLSYQVALDLTSYLPHDTDLLPWDTVVRSFNYITRQLHNDRDFALWQACCAEMHSFMKLSHGKKFHSNFIQNLYDNFVKFMYRPMYRSTRQ